MLFKYSLPFAELSLKYSYTFFKPKGKLSRCLALSTILGGGGGGGGGPSLLTYWYTDMAQAGYLCSEHKIHRSYVGACSC